MAVYKRNDEWGDTWRYRKVVTLPDGRKVRIAGTPAINTKEEAERAEQEHIARELEKARTGTGTARGNVRITDEILTASRGAVGRYWDTDVPGFGVVLGKRKISFVVQARINGQQTTLAIGRWRDPERDHFPDAINAADARGIAAIALAEMRCGRRPNIENVAPDDDNDKDENAQPGIYKRGSRWRIRWIDADGKRQSAMFATEEEAVAANLERRREALAHKTIPIGLPIRLRVIGIYANGAERELQAVDVYNGTPYSDPGIGFSTDDEEFCIFVARRPIQKTEEEWKFDPETDIPAENGAPF